MPSLRATQFLLPVCGALLFFGPVKALPQNSPALSQANAADSPQAGAAETPRLSAAEIARVSAVEVKVSASLAEPPLPAQPGPGRRRFGQKKGAKGNAGGKKGGLVPQNDGTVYDSNQNIYWLADANLAGNLQSRNQILGSKQLKINDDGSMSYDTAVLWVKAMNDYNGKKGWLNHNNWQLPVTPQNDRTCSAHKDGSFGATCTHSALGNLYQVGLGLTFPNSVVSDFTSKVGQFDNLQPALYWTLDTNQGGEVTFSFLTNIQAANTTLYNYMHVLATLPGAINGQSPSGSGVVAYTSGTANGKAVYDSTVAGGRTWLLDANLARTEPFALKGKTTTITSKLKKYPVLTVPLIDNNGGMLFDTANGKDPATGWIAALNHNKYAGASNWALPHYDDLKTLFADLKLHAHDSRLVYTSNVGPFQNLQPFFYWTCQRDQQGTSGSPCNPALQPPPTGTHPMAWSFNFDNGFQGTSETVKPFFVMVYYAPNASPSPSPTPPKKCRTPMQCCIQAGGTWSGGRCE